MLIPSQVILTYVRPSYWLPGLEIAWGILTGLIATVSNAHQVYAIRAFLGLCESSAWPGMMTLLSKPGLATSNSVWQGLCQTQTDIHSVHWYTPLELAKRMGFYHSCQAIGSMMSGAIQAAISSTLEGHSGIAGWRCDNFKNLSQGMLTSADGCSSSTRSSQLCGGLLGSLCSLTIPTGQTQERSGSAIPMLRLP